METVVYNCKFCRREGAAKYEPEFIGEVASWASMLTCNRCGDYLEGFWRYKKVIGRITWNLTLSRRGKRNLEVESTCKDALTEVVRRLTAHCSEFFRIPNYFDQSIVEAMFDEPDRWKDILARIMRVWEGEMERVAPAATQPELAG